MRKLYISLLILMFANMGLLHSQTRYTVIENIHYYEDPEINKDEYVKFICTLDLHYPNDKENFGTIIWFHGGGLTMGRKEVPEALLNKGYAVVGVGYRFSPKVTAPAYIEDAAAAVAWVFKHIAEYGGDKSRIFLSGHSAGGYLNLMVALDKSYLNKYNIDADSIAGLAPVSGQAMTHFAIRKERGIDNKQIIVDEYAPIYHARAEAPPIVLITGEIYKLDGYGHRDLPQGAYSLIIKEINSIKARRNW